MKLNEKFFSRPADKVAKELLGKILCRKINQKILKAKIVETEAYFGSEDPASRAVQNGDLRQTMLMEPATILVYGVHNNWLINFVTNDKGKAEAVLLRALEPLNFKANTKGPGLLTKALKINKLFHKKNICENSEIWIEAKTGNFCINSSTGNCQIKENKDEKKFEIVESFRIGVKKDLPEKLRFYIRGNRFVSRK